MLEADVNLGSVDGSETALSGSKVPIMAHPPDITSDLSLEDFINTIVKVGFQYFTSLSQHHYCIISTHKYNEKTPSVQHVTLGGKSKKGFKLDFKELSIVEPSLKILKKVESQLCSIPFWLNADILRGPSLDSTAAKSTTALPLDAGKFVQVCRKYFEGATLSLGWTTGPCPNDASFYRDSHIEQMIDVIRENSLEVRFFFLPSIRMYDLLIRRPNRHSPFEPAYYKIQSSNYWINCCPRRGQSQP